MKAGLDAAGLSPYLMVQPLAFHTPDAGNLYKIFSLFFPVSINGFFYIIFLNITLQ